MNLELYFNTVRYLKFEQIFHRLKKIVFKAKYVQLNAPEHIVPSFVAPIPRYHSLNGNGGEFVFLNVHHQFTDWNYEGNGALFTYNQNYFDFINAEGFDKKDACCWIDRFIWDIPKLTRGLDPYPTALRCINWIKFFCKYPNCATIEREDSLWSQLCYLEKNLEYHLLGNHLLEDAISLYIGSCYFQDEHLKVKSYRLLSEQLKEQTLGDGAHYEQSPMYHCILLDRLLDCMNIGRTAELERMAIKQLGWLEAICYDDGSWPMFNDSALGIAPVSVQIFDYARRLGIVWKKGELGESGYRKLSDGRIEAMIDCGQIAASYQPGHSHADEMTYELRIDNCPIVVDTGISTYEKNSRRQFERSTVAHNCVCVGGKNSDDVWDGFRVGRRCQVTLLEDGANVVKVIHNGFGSPCLRMFELTDGHFCIEDYFDGDAVSYIHLASGINPECVKIEGASKVEMLDTEYSVEYNKFIKNKTLAIHFCGKVRYTIS